MSDAAEWVARACDPAQYDSSNLGWFTEGAEDSPARKLQRYYLAKHLGDLAGKSVLDVGAGTGHLVTLFPKASRFVAIEPSKNNVAFAREHYPTLDIELASLADTSVTGLFDVAICTMVFEHMADLESALQKLVSLLQPGGRLVIVASDYDYMHTPRFGYSLADRPIRKGESVLEIGRTYGTLYDITRTNERFVAGAESQQLMLEDIVPMPPTEEFVAASPRYAEFRGKPIMQMFLFIAPR